MLSSLKTIVVVLLAMSSHSLNGFAQEPAIEKAIRESGAKVEIYKTTTNSKNEKVELNLYIFYPDGHQATDQRPAIVFFFGGGWKGGKPTQFTKQCQYLASRGMVAMTADYRVSSRHGTKVKHCVSDAKSAVRWIRENASKLGINPNQIASGGGSAGGHIAACTGTLKQYDEPTENKNISSVPNAMVLFNPALVLAPLGDEAQRSKEKMSGMRDRAGVDPETISPVHHVSSGVPPTIVMHGKTDTTVPYATAVAFEQAMKTAGNRCHLIGYEKQGHGFFNSGRKQGKYDDTVKEMDKFLVSVGFLKAKK